MAPLALSPAAAALLLVSAHSPRAALRPLDVGGARRALSLLHVHLPGGRAHLRRRGGASHHGRGPAAHCPRRVARHAHLHGHRRPPRLPDDRQRAGHLHPAAHHHSVHLHLRLLPHQRTGDYRLGQCRRYRRRRYFAGDAHLRGLHGQHVPRGLLAACLVGGVQPQADHRHLRRKLPADHRHVHDRRSGHDRGREVRGRALRARVRRLRLRLLPHQRAPLRPARALRDPHREHGRLHRRHAAERLRRPLLHAPARDCALGADHHRDHQHPGHHPRNQGPLRPLPLHPRRPALRRDLRAYRHGHVDGREPQGGAWGHGRGPRHHHPRLRHQRCDHERPGDRPLRDLLRVRSALADPACRLYPLAHRRGRLHLRRVQALPLPVPRLPPVENGNHVRGLRRRTSLAWNGGVAMTAPW
mmetsp:Transcript_36065/g.89652  ORF Transcript_36065/g.89652 Transcript_36065/m.89652 type:complete len:414 (-) Transcript_36065:203-1444(-)